MYLSLQGAWEDPGTIAIRRMRGLGIGARKVRPLASVRYCDDGLWSKIVWVIQLAVLQHFSFKHPLKIIVADK